MVTASPDGGSAAAAAIAEKLEALSMTYGGHEKRQPLLDSFDLHGVADLIRRGKAQKVVVMAGAGISVSAGIPDFRTPGSGLYSQLEGLNLPWPEAVFDIRYFRHNPLPFFKLAKELWPGYHKHAPTPTHHFLRLLHDKGLLLTVFTQNIDGLEQMAGLPPHKVVPAHGSFDGAHCIDCQHSVHIYEVQAAVYDDEVPTCSSCGGLVKPDITFFGEPLPRRFHRRRLQDLASADLLIVMGTSLAVQPFAAMIDQVPASTPRVLINLTRAGERQQKQHKRCDTGCQNKQHLGSRQCSTSSISSCADGVQQSSSSSSSSLQSMDSPQALTGSSSAGDISKCCSCCDSDESSEPCCAKTSEGEGDTASPAGATGNSSHAGCGGGNPHGCEAGLCAGGFDFDSHTRDVLHLGDCDSAVLQLASLLGWEQELRQLVDAGDAAFLEAQSSWQD